MEDDLKLQDFETSKKIIGSALREDYEEEPTEDLRVNVDEDLE